MLKKLEKFSLPEVETRVLDFWKKNKIFERVLARGKKRKTFVFYEGPPTANGRPGIHHVLGRAFKDVILRYKTMRGYHVPRKGGWDTHGLPVEIEVEKSLGLKSKREIEEYGIAEFNAECRKSVWKYKDEWERLTERMGFWLDMEHPYITYKNEYISVVWQVVREIEKRGLIYKGHKVVPWCTRCGTALSSHELAQGYKEVRDNSVYVKFKVREGEMMGNWKAGKSTYILSWTTTPWTLPGNVALAVGKNIQYVATENAGDEIWYAKESPIAPELGRGDKEIPGTALVGVRYEPLFQVDSKEFSNNEKAFTVQAADFVTTTDGTGVVHTAVMYGEDDYRLGEEIGLPQFHTVTPDGRFIGEVEGLAGLKAKNPETEEKIFEHLRSKGLLFKIEPYVHEYPHCWRCGTPLLYYARHSWFVRMSALRENLLKENKKINWIPENLREGRFGAWLSEAKDWAISRERYWGTPLPIWECDTCPARRVVTGDGDFAELKPRNRYILMRHAYSESNAKDMLDSHGGKKTFPLTKRGEREARATAKKLAKEKIDLIFASDVYRAKQTAEIVSETVQTPVRTDPRLREINVGSLAGTPHRKFDKLPENLKFLEAVPGGESRNDVRRRVYAFLKECEEKYEGKTILLVSHDDPLWMTLSVMNGWDSEEAIQWARRRKGELFPFGGTHKADYKVMPRDEMGVKDYHKPYIDDIVFRCMCGGAMRRVPEVMDVWFDSGSMPWAQKGYLYASSGKKIDRGGFPADYIAEGVDQTRGWFYTMLAIGILLNAGSPYKTAMSLGLLLDSKGQKMSKSKGNVVDPWEMMERHGVDAARWFFFTVNPPGEPKRFDERELTKVSRQVFMILYNSFAFLDLYGKESKQKKISAGHILDRWVMARLHETIRMAEKAMDAYEIGEAARAIHAFVDDLSRWHIRRSRKRFQRPVSEKDRLQASAILSHVMRETAKLLAPFTPFFAEALYKSLAEKAADSVHLAAWPSFEKKLLDTKLLAHMEEARRLASLTLAKRAELGIKVRQPLSELRVKSPVLKTAKAKECLEILKDEVNVKRVAFDTSLTEEIMLDTKITPELKEEGFIREIVRAIQELRQEAGFVPKDKVRVYVSGAGLGLIERHGEFLKREVNARSIEFQHLVKKAKAETTVDLDEGHAWIGVL